MLLDNGWFKAGCRDNVELVTTGIERFTEHGVVAQDSVERPADVVVLATGFKAGDFLSAALTLSCRHDRQRRDGRPPREPAVARVVAPTARWRAAATGSEDDAGTHGDGPVRGEPEVLDRRGGVVRQGEEQPLAPPAHLATGPALQADA